MRVTLGGRYWTRRLVNRLKHGRREFVGDCSEETRELRIVRGQTGRYELDTEIHEALHAQFEWMDESFVARSASELATLLWRLGYRKIEK